VTTRAAVKKLRNFPMTLLALWVPAMLAAVSRVLPSFCGLPTLALVQRNREIEEHSL